MKRICCIVEFNANDDDTGYFIGRIAGPYEFTAANTIAYRLADEISEAFDDSEVKELDINELDTITGDAELVLGVMSPGDNRPLVILAVRELLKA